MHNLLDAERNMQLWNHAHVSFKLEQFHSNIVIKPRNLICNYCESQEGKAENPRALKTNFNEMKNSRNPIAGRPEALRVPFSCQRCLSLTTLLQPKLSARDVKHSVGK